eukprot:6472390-Prymnesium_polylepis.1
MGSQLRMGPQLPHLLHKSSRLTPLRSCTDAYGDVLQSCESLRSTLRGRFFCYLSREELWGKCRRGDLSANDVAA